MKKVLSLLILATASLFATLTTSANVEIVTSPVDLQIGSLNSNSKVFLIPERSFYVLPNAVTLETLDIGTTYNNYWPGDLTVIPAGTVVDVWLIHFNRSSLLLGQQTASFDFGAPILGVAGRSTCLIPNTVCPGDTDQYGNPANTYSNIQFLRGLELLLGEDSIRFDSDSKLTIKSTTSRLTIDEVRVFTLSNVPEPATAGLVAMLLVGFGICRRSQFLQRLR